MVDLLRELKDTSLPTLLVISGILFLVLAVAGKIAGRVEVAPAQQKWSAVIGLGLLLLGVSLDIAPVTGLPLVADDFTGAATAEPSSPPSQPEPTSPLAPTPTATVPAGPTATPEPTRTPEPAPTPAPASPGPAPEQSVRDYWSTVSAGDYPAAWERLSPNFQAAKHGGDFTNYVQGFREMQICSVQATNPVTTQQTASRAQVYSTVVFHLGADCAVSRVDLVFNLTRGAAGWLIDRVDL